MARRITEDDLDGLELSRAGRRDGRHAERAETMLRWATDPAFELDDGLRRAHLMLVAAEHLQMAGDLDRALALAREAGEASDAEPFEPQGTLVSILLERADDGDRDAAIAIADELRRAQHVDWRLHWRVAESIEIGGELALAERWFVIALRALERDPDHDDRDRVQLLSGRYRVRRDAGKDEDVLDLETADLREVLGFDPLE